MKGYIIIFFSDYISQGFNHIFTFLFWNHFKFTEMLQGDYMDFPYTLHNVTMPYC